ncbi:hypothetical protein Pcinc_021259 [Petrolisthes cinctipes]|uniref:FHA domain-containing protein n=1 Tax=Petrolisthes cinctipes TaxID=88211 RepID=A0AAE1FIB8_PETCI|nr:hypothetical protein Pcinc_021259 [Petrolisthes cinctipes]
MGKNKKDYREEVDSYSDGESESSSESESSHSSGSQSSESESSSGNSERERRKKRTKKKSSKIKKEKRSRRSDVELEGEVEYNDWKKRKRRKLSRHRHDDSERHTGDHMSRSEEHKHRSSSRKHKRHHRKHRHKHRRHKRHHSEERRLRSPAEKGEGRRGRDRGEYDLPDRDRRSDRERKEDKRMKEKYERQVRSKWEEEEEEDMQWDANRRIKSEPRDGEEAGRRPLRPDQAQRLNPTRSTAEVRVKEEEDGRGQQERGRSQASENLSPEWGLQDSNEGSGPDRQAVTDEEKHKPNMGLSGKLAEDTNTYNGVVIKYSQPPEARKPKRRWRWYIFKGDEDLPFLPLHRQSAYLIGRDRKVADIPTDHPSCSKQHAVLQYRLVGYQREDGTAGRTVKPYILDLESANGTFVNNRKIEGRRFVELLEKDVVKFGYSSREYILLHEGSKGEDDSLPDTGVDLSPVSLLRN